MKKIISLGLVATLLFSSLALAAGNHPMAGCGLEGTCCSRTKITKK